MEEQTKELNDYLDGFRRRRFSVLVLAGVLFTISLLAAFLWPPTYRSTATILIEEQEIPPELVRSTITSYATQRIQVISQRVMTRTNLMQVIEKYGLYADKRRSETTEDILERMRKDIRMDMINADVIDPRSGRPTQAAIAFTLAYDARNPGVAQQVANELTTLYLNENLKTRTEKATETTNFLTVEADKLGKHIAELESKLATFKEKNADSMPGLVQQINMQIIDRTERDLHDLATLIRAREENKITLEGQLAQINPMSPMMGEGGERILDPGSRLKEKRSEYISASSKYSPDHPDIIRLKREIAALEKETGSVDSTNEQAKVLSSLRSELAAAREKYFAGHPDIVRLTKAVAAQEEALKQRPPAPETDAAKEKPENPAYIGVKTALEATKNELQSLIAKRNELKVKLASYEKKLIHTPEVERAFLTLTRDHENSLKRYQEIKDKQMQAEVGQELEKERKGERFSLIDPPQLPEEPVKPNRPAIIVLGFLLSLAGGIGYAAVAEGVDTSVRGARGITALLSAPPLSVIPYMRNSADIARVKKKKKVAFVTVVGSLAVLVLLVHLLWTPLDVLWFKGLRKMDNVMGG